MGSKNAIVLAAALVCSTQALAQRGFTPEFASGATRPQSVALLPVEATVTRAKIVETQGLVDESVVYGAQFNSQVEALMAAKGYKVHIIDPDRINTDPKLQEYVVDANRAFDEMMKQYRPKKLERRIYNAGDSVRLLAEHLGVDAIAFSNLSMTITPMGKTLVNSLVGGSSSGASSSLAVVSGGTGDLEAVLFGIAIVTPGEKTDEELRSYVAQVAERTVKRLPDADPSARVDVALSDDDVLDEVESLLE
jgi:hypothetical protein